MRACGCVCVCGFECGGGDSHTCACRALVLITYVGGEKKQNPEEPSHAVVSVNVQQSVLRMCVYLHKEESVCQSADLTVSFTPLLFIFSLLKRRNVERVIIESRFVKGKN